jgi:hypothetical protein
MIRGGWRRRTFCCASETGDDQRVGGFDLTGDGDSICTCEGLPSPMEAGKGRPRLQEREEQRRAPDLGAV